MISIAARFGEPPTAARNQSRELQQPAPAPMFAGKADRLEFSGKSAVRTAPAQAVRFGASPIYSEGDVAFTHLGAKVSRREADLIRSKIQWLMQYEPGTSQIRAVFSIFFKAKDPNYPIDWDVEQVLASQRLLDSNGKIPEEVAKVVLASFENEELDDQGLTTIHWVPDERFYLATDKVFISEDFTLAKNGACLPITRIAEIRKRLGKLINGDNWVDASHPAAALYKMVTDPKFQPHPSLLRYIQMEGLCDAQGQVRQDVADVVFASFNEQLNGDLVLVPGEDLFKITSEIRGEMIYQAGGNDYRGIDIAEAIGIQGDAGYDILAKLVTAGITGEKLVKLYDTLTPGNTKAFADMILKSDAIELKALGKKKRHRIL